MGEKENKKKGGKQSMQRSEEEQVPPSSKEFEQVRKIGKKKDQLRFIFLATLQKDLESSREQRKKKGGVRVGKK